MRTSTSAQRFDPGYCTGLAVCVALLASAAAHADDAEVQIDIGDPKALSVGKPASVHVVLRVEGDGLQPLLLTPSTEGRAVSAVRGRLLRSDARDPDARVLHFAVPVLPRSTGTAILRIQVVTYRCVRGCRLVRGTATRVLQVADQ